MPRRGPILAAQAAGSTFGGDDLAQVLSEAPPHEAPASEAAPQPAAQPGEKSAAQAAAQARPAGAAASAPAFEWPDSSRVKYLLGGYYRGELHGTAQVEWVRVGMHYQMNLDVVVGLPFAPLFTRRMTSEGELGPRGLMPRRYDEETKLAFHDRQRATILFEPDAVVLPGGRLAPGWSGAQDSASQFAQLSYWFTLRPDMLTPGRTVTVPLALPRHVQWWVYDVVDEQVLHTPIGDLPTVHLKPRRAAQEGGDLTAEIWFAPTLAYLPARIVIHQDADTFIDLMIARKPQLAK